MAVEGLESRLISALGTKGGYGIFEIFLHHCLLWQRSGPPLKRIESFRGFQAPPSWSWMAYSGAISYVAVPLGEVSWSGDIKSPFSDPPLEDQGYNAPELRAPVWDIIDSQNIEMRLDGDTARIFTRTTKCIVVGKSKNEPADGNQTHYVLLVNSVAGPGDGQVYERIGVAVLKRQHIVLSGPQTMAQIR